MLRMLRNGSALLFLVVAATVTNTEAVVQDCYEFMTSNCQELDFDLGANGYTYSNCEPLWCGFYTYCCNEYCEPDSPDLNDCHEGNPVHGACSCET